MRPIEVRNENGTGPIILSTYGSLFNERYEIRASYRFGETVMPDAFTNTLRNNPDVVFRLEHSGPPLARTTAGNLHLSQDSVGLKYTAELDRDDPDVQSLVPKIRNGNYSESSFAFRCVRDEWNSDRTERRMIELDLHRGDVSICTFGASPGTGRYVQMTRGEESPEERRAFAEAISASHMGGPGAVLLRASNWGNQHGTSCGSCNGNGQCQTCMGKGWVAKTPDGGSGGTDPTGGRMAVSDAEWRAQRARTDALEAEAQLRLARYRQAHPLRPMTDDDMAAIHRRSIELETEALAAINRYRSLV